MRQITSLSACNFRAFSEPVRIDLSALTLLVGPNSAGKSSFTRIVQLLQDSAKRFRLTRLALAGQTKFGSFERIHNRTSGRPHLDLGVGFVKEHRKAHVSTRWMPHGLIRVDWEIDGVLVATAETTRHLDPVEDRVTLSIRPAFFEVYGASEGSKGPKDGTDESSETSSISWESGIDKAMWEALLQEVHTLTWSHVALHSTPLEGLFRPASFVGTEAQEVEWDSRLDDAAKRLVTDRVLPRLADAWSELISILAPGGVSMLAAGEVRQRQVYLEEEAGVLQPLLHAYEEAERAANAPPEDGPSPQDHAIREMRYWLNAFQVADQGLTVRYDPGIGWTPFIRDSAWQSLEESPPLPDRIWDLTEGRVAGGGVDQGPLRTPEEEQELEDLLDAHFETVARARQQTEERRARLPAGGQRLVADFGFGITQLLPALLLAVLPVENEALLVLEEPEANLHPDLQSTYGDLLVAMVLKERRILVETHSEYLVRKLQYLVATGKVRTDDIRIYYLAPLNTPPPRISTLTIGERGTLSKPFGPGFFDESAKLMADLYRFKASP